MRGRLPGRSPGARRRGRSLQGPSPSGSAAARAMSSVGRADLRHDLQGAPETTVAGQGIGQSRTVERRALQVGPAGGRRIGHGATLRAVAARSKGSQEDRAGRVPDAAHHPPHDARHRTVCRPARTRRRSPPPRPRAGWTGHRAGVGHLGPDEPGPDDEHRDARADEGVGQPAVERVEPRLGGAVDEVRRRRRSPATGTSDDDARAPARASGWPARCRRRWPRRSSPGRAGRRPRASVRSRLRVPELTEGDDRDVEVRPRSAATMRAGDAGSSASKSTTSTRAPAAASSSATAARRGVSRAATITAAGAQQYRRAVATAMSDVPPTSSSGRPIRASITGRASWPGLR